MTSAISVRLDAETLRALAQLEATGLSRSEAIRRAILDSAARLQRRAVLAAEVAALEADNDDRREMLEVAAVMEIMRAAGGRARVPPHARDRSRAAGPTLRCDRSGQRAPAALCGPGRANVAQRQAGIVPPRDRVAWRDHPCPG